MEWISHWNRVIIIFFHLTHCLQCSTEVRHALTQDVLLGNGESFTHDQFWMRTVLIHISWVTRAKFATRQVALGGSAGNNWKGVVNHLWSQNSSFESENFAGDSWYTGVPIVTCPPIWAPATDRMKPGGGALDKPGAWTRGGLCKSGPRHPPQLWIAIFCFVLLLNPCGQNGSCLFHRHSRLWAQCAACDSLLQQTPPDELRLPKKGNHSKMLFP